MNRAKCIIYPICLSILLIASCNLWRIHNSTTQTERLYAELAEAVREEAEDKEPVTEVVSETGESDIGKSDTESVLSMQAETGKPVADSEDSDGDAAEDVKQGDGEVINPWILELQKQNPDTIGWIRIEGTSIDYPVMQTEADTDYYLSHDFTGAANSHGAPFLDTNCKLGETENLIIYGHHMKDCTMFQNLTRFKDAAFCQEDHRILLDTITSSASYRVLYVLILSEQDCEAFSYYDYHSIATEEEYLTYLNNCSKYACWTAEELPEAGTPLLTLSTCEYSSENGRLVVICAN